MSQKLCQTYISGQVHNILVLLPHMLKNCPLNDHVDITNKTRSLSFGLSLHPYPNFAYGSSESSGEPVDMHRLS